MKNNSTELVFIIDKSGSMYGMERDTVGGFNSMIDKQKQLDGKVYVSAVLFSTDTKVLYDRVDIEKITPMTQEQYVPDGGTALYDAIGLAIHHIGNVHKYARAEDVPQKTLFVITTDGMENASSIYSKSKIQDMIKRQEERFGWEFMFVAANIDAADTAEGMGIRRDRAANYRQDSKGTQNVYAAVNAALFSVRTEGAVGDDWAKVLCDDDTDEK